ncbi:MAG: biotin--[acetyl-CoA-carboxylase] ligase [Chloroflexi bacterium]|nr:biotin--[acetyl-CoA-carboxylase] ligase [Chloroflexota bacterium]
MLYYDELGSTMDEAWRLAEQEASEGTAVLAYTQTRGRGRWGRSWISPPGASVNLSVVIYPPQEVVPRLSIGAGLAAVLVVERLTGLACTMKWPNDVLLRGRKVAGVLVEARVSESGAAMAVVGMGLNLNFDPALYPEIAVTATSIMKETGVRSEVNVAAEAVLDALDRVYSDLLEGRDLLPEWRSRLETLGRHVEVRWKESVERGLARDVDSEGSLVLERSDGSTVLVPAGEVAFEGQRPHDPRC